MRFLAAVLVIAVSCSAQAPAKRKPGSRPAAKTASATPDGWPLLSLKITGNHLYTEQQIAAVSGLKTGQVFTKAQLEAVQPRLLKTGAFGNVEYQFGPTSDGKGYQVTIEVAELDQVYPFRFEDLPAPEAQLRQCLGQREPLFHEKMPGTTDLINRFAADLQECLANTSFKDKVTGKVVPDKPGELAVLFRPATGRPVIAEVQFIGNQVLPSTTLGNTLSAVAIGVPYREATVRTLLDTSIRPLYDGKGRLKVAFPKIETEKAKQVDGLRVKIQVDEGPAYNFGTIQSAVPLLQPRRVLKLATFKTGEPADFDKVSHMIDGIQSELRKEGYMRSQTHVERTIHDKEKTVDLKFTADLGPKFLMGKLDVQGLDVVSEPAVRKLWSMRPGDPYNANYPQFFLDRIKQDGYFDNLAATRYDQSIDEKTYTVDVTLHFRGGVDPEERRKQKEQQKERENPPF